MSVVIVQIHMHLQQVALSFNFAKILNRNAAVNRSVKFMFMLFHAGKEKCDGISIRQEPSKTVYMIEILHDLCLVESLLKEAVRIIQIFTVKIKHTYV